jgi:hypothetical protein
MLIVKDSVIFLQSSSVVIINTFIRLTTIIIIKMSVRKKLGGSGAFVADTISGKLF